MTLHNVSDVNGFPDPNAMNVRIRRGARAIGADGDLGAIQQIVVDQDTGELRGLVVQRASDGAEFELPGDVVRRATDDEVWLDLTRADLDSRPDLARPYDPDQYIAVQPGDTAPRVQATRTAHDTGRPVVTNVDQDSAEMITPPPAPHASDAAHANVPLGAASASTDDDSDTLPRHDPSRADIGEETLTPAPPRQESATPGATGDIIGGKPSSGGMGAASTPPTSTTLPLGATGTDNMRTSFAAPAQRQPEPAASASSAFDDLADLSDDELSNPDAALINPLPGAEDRIARPFSNGAPSAESVAPNHTAPQSERDRAGLASAFRTATGASADDTHVLRDPAFNPLDKIAAPETDDPGSATIPRVATPMTPYEPRHPATALAEYTTPSYPPAPESDEARRLAELEPGLAARPTSSRVTATLPRNTSVAGMAAAIIAGDTALRMMGASRLRWFARGLLVGAAVALVLTPLPGSNLRAQLASAAERLRANVG